MQLQTGGSTDRNVVRACSHLWHFLQNASAHLDEASQPVHRDVRSRPSGHLVLDDAGLLRGVADLRWRLDDLLPHGAQALVVDIHGLTRLSSQTLAALLWAQRRCRLRGGHVRLVGANRRSRELLARTGLTEVFHVLRPDERTD